MKHISNRWLHIALSLAVTACLLYVVVSESGVDGLLEALQAIDLKLLGVYLGLSIAALLMRAYRYRLIVDSICEEDEVPSVKGMLVVTAIRNALVDFLPARLGELSYLYVLNRYGVTLAAGVTSFGVCFALDIVVLIVLVLMLLLASVTGHASGLSLMADLSTLQMVLVFATVGILFLIGVVLLAALDSAAQFAVRVLEKVLAIVGLGTGQREPQWIERLRTFCADLVEDCRRLRTSGAYGTLVVLTFGLRAAKYGSLYVLLLAIVGHWSVGAEQISLFASTIGFLAAEAGASLPISGLMSFGAYEGAWALVFGLACGAACEGLPRATVALSVHLVTQVLGYGLGILAGAIFVSDLVRNNNKGSE